MKEGTPIPRVWVTPAYQHLLSTQRTSPSCKLRALDLLCPWASFTPPVKRESSFFHFTRNFFPARNGGGKEQLSRATVARTLGLRSPVAQRSRDWSSEGNLG